MMQNHFKISAQLPKLATLFSKTTTDTTSTSTSIVLEDYCPPLIKKKRSSLFTKKYADTEGEVSTPVTSVHVSEQQLKVRVVLQSLQYM
jgi:hypothetical protein